MVSIMYRLFIIFLLLGSPLITEMDKSSNGADSWKLRILEAESPSFDLKSTELFYCSRFSLAVLASNIG